MPNQVRIGVGTQGANKAASELDQLKDKFTKLQGQGAKGFAIGAGAAITAGAFGLLSQAADGAVGFLSDAIKAFNEDEASVARLGAALKANVPAWDGNTAAIEKTLLAREKLGFTDDEQRDSLAVLVAKTHDVTKALNIQAAAMDLARLKGITLADATSAISKGMSGSGRALKELGINVKDYASQTEILTAVQKAAAGQAEAYAKTNEGKLLVSQVKVGEAMERLGSVLAGPVADGAAAAADAITKVIEALDATSDAVKSNEDPLNNLGNLLHDLFKSPSEQSRTFTGAIGDALNEVNSNLGDSAAAINDFWTFWDDHSNLVERRAKRVGTTFTDLKDTTASAMEGMRGDTEQNLQRVTIAVDDTASDMESKRGRMEAALRSVGHTAKGTAYDFEEAARRIQASSQKTASKLASDAQSDIDNAFDPQINYYKLVAANAEVSAAKRKAAAKGASAAEQEALLQAEKSQAEFLLASARAGKQNTKAYKEGVANLRSEIKAATGPTKQYLEDVLRRLHAIDSLDPNITIRVNAAISKQAKQFGVVGGTIQDFSTSTRRRAKGGPVSAGVAYRVGEQGEETFVPKTDGTIIPHGAQGKALGGSMVLNVTVNASPGMTPAAARDIGNALGPAVAGWMQRNNILPRGASPLHG